jgi:hypothetical protein
MLFKVVISEFGAKIFDSCEQNISLFQMKEQVESLLGVSIEKYKTFDSIKFILHFLALDFVHTLRMLFKEVISEFGAKTFDSCEQKISLFQMKEQFETLLGISIEKYKTFDSI